MLVILGIELGIPSTIRPTANCFVARVAYFSRMSFRKSLSGRTIEFDKVFELKQDEQSSAAPEAVPEMAKTLMALVSTKCCSPGDRNDY